MYSSFKKQKLLTESWRKFLKEAESIPEDPLELIRYYSNKAGVKTEENIKYYGPTVLTKYKYSILKELYGALKNAFKKEYLFNDYLEQNTYDSLEGIAKEFRNLLESKVAKYFPEASDEREPEYLRFNPFTDKEDSDYPKGFVYDYSSVYHKLLLRKQANSKARIPEEAIKELDKVLNNLKSDLNTPFPALKAGAINSIDFIIKTILSKETEKETRNWYIKSMERIKDFILNVETRKDLTHLLFAKKLSLNRNFVTPLKGISYELQLSFIPPSEFINKIKKIMINGIDYFNFNTTQIENLVSELGLLEESIGHVFGRYGHEESTKALVPVLKSTNKFKEKLMLIVVAIEKIKEGMEDRIAGIKGPETAIAENLNAEQIYNDKVKKELTKNHDDVYELEDEFRKALEKYSKIYGIPHIHRDPGETKPPNPLDIPSTDSKDIPRLPVGREVGFVPPPEEYNESKLKSKRRR